MKEDRKRTGRPHYQIAVPTDFSPPSTAALKFAQQLAKAPGTRVIALHAIDSLEYSFGPEELRQQKKAQTWAQAEESMARWLQESGVSKCGKSLTEGEAAPAVTQFIVEDGIDLAVLNTSARLRASRIVLGSVAEEIFREATCPVFVLGPNAKATNQKLTRLVFATDLEPHSLAALPALSKFARKFNCSVSVVRAVHPDIRSRSERSRIREETRKKVETVADADLRKRIADVHVEFAGPVEAITAFARRRKAGAIVLGVRGGGAWERATTHIPWALAHRIIAQAKLPVLTLRG